MSAMEITRKIEQLPPDMQQEVHDFVDFLAKKSRRQRRHLHMAPPTQAVVAGTPFREGADIATQAQLQGVKPVTDFEALLGNFWPEEENIDVFLEELYRLRQEGGDVGDI